MDKIDQTLSSTGLLTTTRTEELTGQMHTTYEQDLEPSHEYVKGLKSDAYWKHGVKNNWAHALHVPEVAVMQLRKMGINVFDPNVRLQDVARGLRALEMGNFILRDNA